MAARFDERVISWAGATVWRRHAPASAGGRLSRVAAFAEENGTLVVVVCAAAVAFLVRLPTALAADSWMVLLSGREIVQHGLPSHDTITVWAHGHRWVDQQWLAQVAMYGLERLGGFRLVLLAHAALATGGFAAACSIARRRGASALSVTWIGAIGLLAFYPEAVTLRSQSFAYVLFVAVLALLLRDRRRSSKAVFLVFPLLALWANLHGSVVVGAALVSLYGLLALPTSKLRGVVLAVVPWACVLASPYAGSLPSYYRWILFDVHFSRYITEWAPTTLRLVTASVFVLAIGGAWLLGRGRECTNAFEALAFVGTGALAFQAERNMPWFGLAAILILPGLLDRVRVPQAQPRSANRIFAGASILATIAAVAVVGAKGDSWLLRRYPAGPANVAAATAGSSQRIFANESYADWLVWTHPTLSGRIAFDARFELLTNAQLAALFAFRTGLGDWPAAAAGYGVLVLSAKDEAQAIGALVRTGAATRIAGAAGIVVLRRNPAS